jgi:hypothetical protein
VTPAGRRAGVMALAVSTIGGEEER